MKARHVTFIILLIIIADQALKLWIKTNFHLDESRQMIGSGFQLYFVEKKVFYIIHFISCSNDVGVDYSSASSSRGGGMYDNRVQQKRQFG